MRRLFVNRTETLPSVQPETAVDELIAARMRADVAEKMLMVLQAQLTEMTAQRDRWEHRFDQLLATANTSERRPWWRRLAG
jgi:hypothetical protein